MQQNISPIVHIFIGTTSSVNYKLTQCDSSYGFSVIVRVTVTGFIIFQLQLQLKLTNKMFSVIVTVSVFFSYS